MPKPQDAWKWEANNRRRFAETWGVEKPPGSAFGAQLRLLRKQLGLTQRQLAARAGVAQQAIAMLERRPGGGCNADTLSRMSQALNVSMDELYGQPAPANDLWRDRAVRAEETLRRLREILGEPRTAPQEASDE